MVRWAWGPFSLEEVRMTDYASLKHQTNRGFNPSTFESLISPDDSAT